MIGQCDITKQDRHNTTDITDVFRSKLEQALQGDFLPTGLTKTKENKYKCENKHCRVCPFIQNPYQHFKSGHSDHTCHLCKLFRSSDDYHIFQQLASMENKMSKQ